MLEEYVRCFAFHKEGGLKVPKVIDNLDDRILEKSRNILFEKGFQKMNMRSVAEQCNVAVGTLYNYYPSKEMLASAIMFRDWGRMLDDVGSRIRGITNLTEGLKKIYQGINEYLAEYIRIWNDYKGGIASYSNEKHEKIVAGVETLVSRLMEMCNVENSFGPDAEDAGKTNKEISLSRFISEILLNITARYEVPFEAVEPVILKLTR